jgi:polyhydroxyalkanoate synthase subunit PhaC
MTNVPARDRSAPAAARRGPRTNVRELKSPARERQREDKEATVAAKTDGRSPADPYRRRAGELLRVVDPVGFGASFARTFGRLASRPLTTLEPTTRYAGGLFKAYAATAARMVGVNAEGPVAPAPHDSRFNDEAWSRNPFYYAVLQLYLLNDRLVTELLEAADVPGPDSTKSKFASSVVMDAMAPSNYLLTNPKALKRAFDTGGRSLVHGARNYLQDLSTNGGWPSQVRKSHFRVGENMGLTKGQVVFRNDLIELIQYHPLTPEVHSVPLLSCPPWINKYYALDLAPGKSLVEWAIQHGLTVFQISYRNPDGSMRDVSFDDYLFKGPLAAIEVVQSITGSPKVNTLSVCLGGTLNAVLVAYLEAKGEDVINNTTYLNTAVDFRDIGPLQDIFTDQAAVDAIVEKMEKRGYLAGSDMAHTFSLLRANDLVFRYLTSNWLMGEDPPDFDLLAWNNDSTNMPAKMHAYYIQRCIVDNAIAKDELEVEGTRLMFSKTSTDSYFVAALNDHIVPWRTNYRTTQLFHGKRRFVLTSGGHVAGVVNPPNPKSKHWTNEDLPADPDQWLAGAKETANTWWNDWANWIVPRSGALKAPPPLGNKKYPAGVEAPGTYVFD